MAQVCLGEAGISPAWPLAHPAHPQLHPRPKYGVDALGAPNSLPKSHPRWSTAVGRGELGPSRLCRGGLGSSKISCLQQKHDQHGQGASNPARSGGIGGQPPKNSAETPQIHPSGGAGKGRAVPASSLGIRGAHGGVPREGGQGWPGERCGATGGLREGSALPPRPPALPIPPQHRQRRRVWGQGWGQNMGHPRAPPRGTAAPKSDGKTKRSVPPPHPPAACPLTVSPHRVPAVSPSLPSAAHSPKAGDTASLRPRGARGGSRLAQRGCGGCGASESVAAGRASGASGASGASEPICPRQPR